MSGLREYLNKYPLPIAAGIVFVVLLLLIGVHRSHRSSSLQLERAYYSDDDGKTYAEGRIPRPGHPNDKVQAMVFGCSGGEAPFIGFLQREGPNGIEVKKPGSDNPWVVAPPPMTPGGSASAEATAARKQYEDIVRVTCPGGGTAVLLMPRG